MPVDATWRIQSNSGQVTSTTGFTATLPNPTMDQSTLLLFIGTAGGGSTSIGLQSFDPPFVEDHSHGGQWYVWRRPVQPAGETSWAIAPSGALSVPWYWRIEEWAGLSSIGQPDAAGTISSGAGTLTEHTDEAAANTTADVADFVALAVFRAGGGVGAWPAGHSYGPGNFSGPSSWNEVAYLVNGTGSNGTTDFILAIAEAYPGATGNVAAGLTFDTSGGGSTPNSLDAWCVCYQPGMPSFTGTVSPSS